MTGGLYDGGYFLPPTVIADTDHSMKIMTEETFGPVLGVMKVDGPAEALRLANDTDYGLAGFVFNRPCRPRAGSGRTHPRRIGLGQRHPPLEPFGSLRRHEAVRIGREKGHYGVESYLEYKTIYLSYDEGLA